MGFSRAHNVVQLLKAVSTCIDCCRAVRKELEVNSSSRGDSVDVVEAPDSENLHTRCCNVTEDKVDVTVIVQEGKPVRVGPDKVICFSINGEVETIDFRKAGRSRS